MIKIENATLYINGKNCGVIESSDVNIKIVPYPLPAFVLDNIKFSGAMTIISSPPFERTMEYKAYKEACIEEAKRAVAEYKRKADSEFDDVSLDMILEEYHDLHENIHEEYAVKARVKETLFDVFAILGLDDDYTDWCFEGGEWKQ